MSRIVLPPRWQVPPVGAQLDTSHPLYTSIAALWPLNEGSGKLVNNLAAATPIFPSTGPHSITGTPTWVAGPRGQCLSFDGSTNYVDTGAKAIMPSGNGITIACWFKWTQAVGSVLNFVLLDTSNQQASNGYTIYLQTSATQYTLASGCRDSSAHISNCNVVVTGIADNKWHLGVMVRDPQTVGIRLYLDGVLVKSVADSTVGALGGTNNVVIGASGSGHTNKLLGQLAMPAIWSRALSVGEIGQLYAAPYDLFAGNRLVYVIPFTAIAGSATDSASISASRALSVATGATDSASALESLASASSLSLADTAAVIEALARTLAMSPAEVLALGDALTLTMAGSVTDALAGVDSAAPELAQNHTSRLNPNDVLVQAGGAVIVDGVSVADTFTVFVPILPIGGGRVIHATIATRTVVPSGKVSGMVIVGATSTYLDDVRVGDTYPITVQDALLVAGQITAARFVLKSLSGDADPGIIDFTVTSSPTSRGQIVTDGSGSDGAYKVQLNLMPADAAVLATLPAGDFDPAGILAYVGYWEVRLTTAAGAEYTPVSNAPFRAVARLIKAS